MIKPYIYVSDSTDPWHNLAVEEYFQKRLENDSIVMYLWQNANTVVIGRSQNPWKECNLDFMESHNVKIARRNTGGGAVYHDLQNLNFSFIVPKDCYDYHKQAQVIIEAVKTFGIKAECNGRNDIITGGRKFSGNAFSKMYKAALHHGTILINTDVEVMSGSLQVSTIKMNKKGVSSVASRVVNLKEIVPSITVKSIKESLITAFEKIYGVTQTFEDNQVDFDEIKKYEEKNGSYEWLYGDYKTFDFSIEHRFLWGDIQINANVSDGYLKNTTIYSDSLNPMFIERMAQLLNGVQANMMKMVSIIEKESWDNNCNDMVMDIVQWLSEKTELV